MQRGRRLNKRVAIVGQTKVHAAILAGQAVWLISAFPLADRLSKAGDQIAGPFLGRALDQLPLFAIFADEGLLSQGLLSYDVRADLLHLWNSDTQNQTLNRILLCCVI